MTRAILLLTLLFIVVVTCCVAKIDSKEGNVVRMEINLNLGSKQATPHVIINQQDKDDNEEPRREEPSTPSHMQQHEQAPISDMQNGLPAKVDSRIAEESKEIIDNAKSLISKKEETQIAEHYIKYASNLKQIYDKLPDNSQTKPMKEVMATFIQEFTRKASHPTSDILKGSLTDITWKRSQSKQKVETELSSQSDGGASTLFMSNAISNMLKGITGQMGKIVGQVGSTLDKVDLAKLMEKMGSYSGGVNIMGSTLSKYAEQLSKMGYPQLAQLTSQVGGNIQQFSTKTLAPLETTLSDKVLPILQTGSSITQSAKKIIGVVQNSKTLNNVKLPKKFQEMQGSLRTLFSKKVGISNPQTRGPSINRTKPLRLPSNSNNPIRPIRPSRTVNRIKPSPVNRPPLSTKLLRVTPPRKHARQPRPTVNHVKPMQVKLRGASPPPSAPRPATRPPPRVVHTVRSAPAVVHRAAPVSAGRRR